MSNGPDGDDGTLRGLAEFAEKLAAYVKVIEREVSAASKTPAHRVYGIAYVLARKVAELDDTPEKTAAFTRMLMTTLISSQHELLAQESVSALTTRAIDDAIAGRPQKIFQ
jgi:hypothetical protein